MKRKQPHTGESLFCLVKSEAAGMSAVQQDQFVKRVLGEGGLNHTLGWRLLALFCETNAIEHELKATKAKLPGRKVELPDLHKLRYRQKYVDGHSWSDLRTLHEKETPDVSFETVRSGIKRLRLKLNEKKEAARAIKWERLD